MRKNAAQAARKAAKSKKVLSVDDQLTEHLKQAEHHLIEALLLFHRTAKPSRTIAYLARLERAQEAITGLYREELVRIRGPVKIKRAVKH